MSAEFNMGDLLPVFLTEADEQIAVLDASLLHLEKEGQDTDLVREIFRAAHTLKGSSAAMGFAHLAGLTHAMENVFDAIRHQSVTVTDEVVDRLLEALDMIKAMRDAIGESGTDSVEAPVAVLADSLRVLAAGQPAPAAPETAAPAPEGLQLLAAPEAGQQAWRLTVRFAADCEMPAVRAFMVLNELAGLGRVAASDPAMDAIQEGHAGRDLRVWMHSDRPAEELRRAAASISEVESAVVSAEAAAAQPAAAPAHAGAASDARGTGANRGGGAGRANTQTVRVSVDRLDNLMNLVGELVIDRTRITRVGALLEEEHAEDATKDLLETALHLGRVVGEVQDEIMKARMLPIDQVFLRFPRMIRDLARKAGKEIDFQVEGGETELDRSVIESIVDPLTHLLRNSVDHGIEPPEERERLGKPRAGRVTIRARHEENQIVVGVEDDGRGIDVERVRAKAVRSDLLSSADAAALSPREALQLIFLSGLSTAEQVTDISGRGVGMDIVNNNIQRLGGSVDVDTAPGAGSRFTVRLPLTLAIIRGLLVDNAGDTYVIPLNSVAETLRVGAHAIQRIQGRDTLLHRGSVLPLVTLDQVFGRAQQRERQEHCFVVVARYGQTHLGIIVDKLIGEQEIVIKPLAALIGEAGGLAGASILGSGQVALILDIPAFAAAAGDRGMGRGRALAA